jgi:riboflavin biosynthesis pyrimidine reductase
MVTIDSLLPALDSGPGSGLGSGAASGLDDAAIVDHYRAGTRSSWLRVNFVSSVDGAATVDGKSGGLGNDADQHVFDILRRLCDVVLVGAGTVRTEGYGPMILDDASVDTRVALGLKPQPVFAIVSGRLDLDPKSPIFQRAPVKPIIVTTASADPFLRERLGYVADILVCGEEEVDAGAMVAALRERGLGRIHCEGGPTLFGTLLAANLVDELCLTVSPMIAAGAARRIAHEPLTAPRRMSLAGVLRSDDTLLLRYTREPE